MAGPVSVEEAIGRLQPGMRVLVPPGCGEPTPLIDEVVRQAERLRPLTLMGGLHLGGHPFCAPEHHGRLRWVTFHAMPALRDALARDQAEFVPLRYFDAPWAFGPDGALGGRRGPRADGAARRRRPALPRRVDELPSAGGPHGAPRHRRGQPADAADPGRQHDPSRPGRAWVETDRPLVPYASPAIGEVERRIAAHVAEIVPDGATIQVGIGATPEAVVSGLGGHRDLGVHSALFDSMLPLLERGVITGARNRRHPGCLDLGEIMGTEPLFRWVHENPRVHMEPSTTIHDPRVVAALERFVSINSAIEVDLTGQVNAEALGARQVAGIGGQFDFVAGAALGGDRSVIALPSTGRRGEVSRIVTRLAAGTPVTTPRHLVDCVVTEFGRAELRGLSDGQRARELTRLAHPRFREELEREWRAGRQAF